MKKIICTLGILFLPIFAFAQEENEESFPTPFKFTLIDTVELSKNEIYVKVFEWVAKKFNSANDVIQMQDKEAGKIIGKGNFTVDGPKNGFGTPLSIDRVKFTLTIDIKDGRYRCVISDMLHEAGPSKGRMSSPSYGSLEAESVPKEMGFSMQRRWDGIKSSAMADSKKLLRSLKKYVRSKNDDDF